MFTKVKTCVHFVFLAVPPCYPGRNCTDPIAVAYDQYYSIYPIKIKLSFPTENVIKRLSLYYSHVPFTFETFLFFSFMQKRTGYQGLLLCVVCLAMQRAQSQASYARQESEVSQLGVELNSLYPFQGNTTIDVHGQLHDKDVIGFSFSDGVNKRTTGIKRLPAGKLYRSHKKARLL